MDKVSSQASQQKSKFRVSKDTKVGNAHATIHSLNREFQLGRLERDAAYWGIGFEPGNTMFHVVNAYARGAEFQGLSAEGSYRMQRLGGGILGRVR
jgi:hypothetical protein